MEHKRFFQQVSNYFQPNLTRKNKLVVFRNIYVSIFQKQTYFPWDARKATPAKIPLQCNPG